MENYAGAKQDFAIRSGLIQKERLFTPEQMTEIYMDFEKYGQDCMENDCVTKTEFGLLRRLDPPFPEQTQGQQMFQ